MSVHDNSIAAYHQEEPALSKRAAAIVGWIRICGGGTDREIAAGMGFSHRSAVQPRISELVEKGLLEEVRSVRCPITGKRVRVVDIPRPRGQLAFPDRAMAA